MFKRSIIIRGLGIIKRLIVTYSPLILLTFRGKYAIMGAY